MRHHGGSQFFFCSTDANIAVQLSQALGELGSLTLERPRMEQLASRLSEIGPQIVFLDFTRDDVEPGKLLESANLARLLAFVAPAIPRVAVGRPEEAIAALRAGVSDFIDPFDAPQEVRDVVQRLLDPSRSYGAGGGTHRSVLLMGARAGVGTSTLTVHLASMMQDRLQQEYTENLMTAAGKDVKLNELNTTLPLANRAAVLDLGWPVGDCPLYLNVGSEFDFAEAVRNLARLDSTLLGSAMAYTSKGLGVLALPHDLTQMRDVSQADSLLLFERFSQHFGVMMVDAGGFSSLELLADLSRSSQQSWIVTDQSVGALVSLAGMLQELEKLHVSRRNIGLIVNRYDERYGMTAQQIAERFQLELIGTLPDRTLALMSCTSQGKLLNEQAERDNYVRAAQGLLERLRKSQKARSVGQAQKLVGWLPRAIRRIGQH